MNPTDELARLYEMLYVLPVGIVAFGDDDRVEAANPLAVQLLAPVVAPTDMSHASTALAPLVGDLAALMRRNDGVGAVVDQRRTTIRAGGQTPMVVETTLRRVRSDLWVATLQDVTEEARRERELRQEQNRFGFILDVVQQYAIYSLDHSGVVDTWNSSTVRLFGRSPEEALGLHVRALLGIDDETASSLLRQATAQGWSQHRGWAQVESGRSVYLESTFSPVLGDCDCADVVRIDGVETCGFVVITRDATDMFVREEQLRQEAETDPLTGLVNRRGCERRAALYATACQTGEQPLAVLLIDIDHFKAVNDTHGHDVGDEVLRQVGARLLSRVRAADVVSRYGGEEFIVLLPGAGAEDALRVAEGLRHAIGNEPFEIDARLTIPITISIGVAPCRATVIETIEHADQALYDAKHTGRNRAVLYTPVTDD